MTSEGRAPAAEGTIGVASLAIALLVLQAAAWASVHWLGGQSALGWAARVMLSSLVIGVIPGLLITALVRPKPDWTILELAGIGLAVTFGVVQLMTIVSLSAHLPADYFVSALTGWNVIGALGLLAWRPPLRIQVPRAERILAAALLVLAVFLYIKGSPYNSVEDEVHVTVMRRLMFLGAPRLDNVYYSPGIVYTYPYPGTHFFMALIGKFSGADALFVYHKLRAFWGPAALVFVLLAARAIFGGGPAVGASVIAAVVFVLSGAFSTVPGFFWGQLAPHSHASDVVMGVILPALLVVTFEYFIAATTRAVVFFFATAMLLVLMLTIVHIRELVQYVAYVGIYVGFLLAFRPRHLHLRRALAICAVVVPFVVFYGAWHNHLVGQVDTLVAESRARLREVASTASIHDLLIAQPLPLLNGFYAAYWATFYGWNPFLLCSLPIVAAAFARRPLVWLIAASSFVYVLAIRFPFIAIPYIYFTYFEILFTPVRNFIFFMHVYAGVALFILAALLARRGRVVGALLGLVVGGLLGFAWTEQNLFLNAHGDVLYVPLIALSVWALYEIVHAGRMPDVAYVPPNDDEPPLADAVRGWRNNSRAEGIPPWRSVIDLASASWHRSAEAGALAWRQHAITVAQESRPLDRHSPARSGPARARRSTLSTARWLGIAVALAGAIGLIGISAVKRSTAQRMPMIHVLWAPTVTANRRVELERTFALAAGERILDNPGQSWSYAVADVSTTNMRSLVTSPEVSDTNDVDRDAFAVRGSAGISNLRSWAGYRQQWLFDPLTQWGPYVLLAIAAWSLWPWFASLVMMVGRAIRAAGGNVADFATSSGRAAVGVSGALAAAIASATRVVGSVPAAQAAGGSGALPRVVPPVVVPLLTDVSEIPSDWRSRFRGTVASPPSGWPVVFVALLVPMAIGSFTKLSSPLGRSAAFVATPDQLVAEVPCIERRDVAVPYLPAGMTGEPPRLEHILSCPPSMAIIRWFDQVSPDAVVAMSKWLEYSPSIFLPQQFVTWSYPGPVFLHEEELFPQYYKYYHRSMAAYRQQPFFNDRETRAERLDFVRGLGVTHILVDPDSHDMMTRTLGTYPDLFARRYDDGRWAAWEVVGK